MAENINITPEMLSNLIKNFSTSSNNNNNSSQNTKTFNNKESAENQNSDFSFNGLDVDTIMKIKSIMEVINKKDDTDSKLLYSLKPYLRKSRQEKIDQYASILKFSHISKMFKHD